MLAEEYEVLDGHALNEECCCLVLTVEIDGRPVQVHHWIPDDSAPHVPDSECGCHPILHTEPGILRYEHLDQDNLECVA
jgi:hypothetical protein